MDRATDIVGRATEAIFYVLPHVSEVVERELVMPHVYGAYHDGSAMKFLSYELPGIIKVNVDIGWSNRYLRAVGAHELGHAALFQANPETHKPAIEKEDVPYIILNEGVAEHVQETIRYRLAKSGKLQHLLPAVRQQVWHTLHLPSSAPIYGQGYRHVRALRNKGVTLGEMVRTPFEFLPKV